MVTFRDLELPQEVLNKIIQKCEIKGRKFDIDFDSTESSVMRNSGFNWTDTEEGHNFWRDILNPAFNGYDEKGFRGKDLIGLKRFYELYPENKIIYNNSRSYSAIINNKKYKITIEEDEN